MYACLPERSMGSLSADFCTWSDSPVKELSSIFRSFPWIRIPSAGRRSPERGNKSGTNKYPVISRASLICQKAFTVPTSNAILHRVHYQQMSSHCDLWKCEHYSKNTFVLIHTFLILGELSLISAFIPFHGLSRTGNWPYLTWAMSPTTNSATGIWMTVALRTTANRCSSSMRLCSPRNCFSLLQSLKAVTSTTQMTDSRMATPSIHPASASPSSSAPPDTFPQAAEVKSSLLHGRLEYSIRID